MDETLSPGEKKSQKWIWNPETITKDISKMAAGFENEE